MQTRAADDATSTVRLPAISVAGVLSLLIFEGAGLRRVPLLGRPVVLGSGAGADVVLADPAVSGAHCRFEPNESGAVVRDLGSKNGTFVGGARVTDAILACGSTITIGRTTMVVVGGESVGDDGRDEPPLVSMVGDSLAMRRVAGRVRRLARYQSPVLIQGETGVGKELIARALHEEGPRRGKPYVVLNVAALPRELVESELFGHERGAFTGAVGRKGGAFEDAEDGTLFLDEIGDLPLEIQPKLLRALDGYEVRRVGSGGSGRVANVRILAATHARLSERVEAGTFRRDLFHRLEVFSIDVPPLRERDGDVALIARKVLADFEAELGPRRLSGAAISRLLAHDWPGNVRELRNVLLRAADASGEEISAAEIDIGMRTSDGEPVRIEMSPAAARAVFEANDRNLMRAARACGVARTSFRRLLEKPV